MPDASTAIIPAESTNVATGNPGLSWRAWTLLIGYTLTLFVFNLGAARTFTGHECYVAEAAREMLATGDWLVPRIAGDPWLEKPPLPHWIVATVGWLTGGVNEFTARLPSAAIALLGVVLITQLAVHWGGVTRGLLTGFIQATTVYTATYAHLAESDIYLWLVVLGCLVLFARNQVEPSLPTRWYDGPTAFFVLLGLTQMVKGPLFGAAIALLPCLGFAALQRRWSAWKWFFSWPGLLLFVVISTAWPAAILLRYPEAWWLWKLHTFGRFGDQCLNPHPWWYYASTIPWQLLPWTPLILLALPGSWRRARSNAASPDCFLWLWFLLPLLLLSTVKAKHHHYLIYSLPACSFWAADGIMLLRGWADRLATSKSRLWLTCTTAVAISLAGIFVCHRVRPEFTVDAAVLAGILSAASVGATAAWSRRRYPWMLASVFAASWLVYAYVHGQIMPKTDRYADETAFLRRLNGPEHEGARLLIYGYEPARILLYCRLPAERFESFQRLRERYDELPKPYLATSLGHIPPLDTIAEISCVDHANHARWADQGAFTQLGVFRLHWRTPGQPAKSATPTSFSLDHGN